MRDEQDGGFGCGVEGVGLDCCDGETKEETDGKGVGFYLKFIL